MKRTVLILISLLAVLLLPACQKDLEERLQNLQNDVTNLEEQINKLNESISSLSSLVDALEKNDHISGVTSFTSEGKTFFKVSFTSGNTLYLTNGTDGVTPIVGVRYNEEYDAYYWTIQMGENGKETWMTDSYGQRVRAIGWVPRLKIEDGIWWYSFDGTYWSKAGWGSAQGTSGSSVFKSIDTSDPYFVSFVLANNTFFRLPTQFAIDEITAQCGRINDDIKTYTALANRLDSAWFVKSVVSFEDPNGDSGERIILENGQVLTIRNGRDGRDSVLLSAKTYTDGKLYWVFRSRSDQEYQWLTHNGEMVCLTLDDVTPHINIVDSLGHLYFTVTRNGQTEMMRGKDGNLVEATGSVVLDFFTAVDTSDPNAVVLTMSDGATVRLPRTRLYAPTVEFSKNADFVEGSKRYTYMLLAFVRDTLPSRTPCANYEAYAKASGMRAEAIAVDDGCTVSEVKAVSFMATVIEEGTAYEIIYDIPFSTGASDSWDLTRPMRLAFFLTWQNSSLVRVAEFSRRLNATAISLDVEELSLEEGAARELTVSFLPVNHNQPGTVNWSTSDETVAIVSHTGVVTAVAEGTCTITAHFGNLTATCAVTVTKKAETP